MAERILYISSYQELSFVVSYIKQRKKIYKNEQIYHQQIAHVRRLIHMHVSTIIFSHLQGASLCTNRHIQHYPFNSVNYKG